MKFLTGHFLEQLYNAIFVFFQNHICAISIMVAANTSAFHHGRKAILWCSVCVRPVTDLCQMGVVWVSNLVISSNYLKIFSV
jgi:hypothetical protein